MRIGEVAARLGVEVHVLRHWDEVGIVVPDRSAGGQRTYTEEHVHRLRVLQVCQAAGLSLAEVRQVLHRDDEGRADVIRRRLRAVREQRAVLAEVEAFLEHVVGCRHDLMTRCPDCARFPSHQARERTTTA